MDWKDEAAAIIDQVTRDPMAGAERGTVEILAIGEPAARPRYQEARIELRADAPGREPVILRTHVVLDRKHWPTVGTKLPARIPPGDSLTEISIDWGNPQR